MTVFRYRTIQVFIAIAFAAIAARLIQFQIIEGHKYSRSNSAKNTTISIARGELVDRNSKVLALDLDKYTLEYNPTKTDENRELLAQSLSRIIGFSKPELLASKSSQTLAYNLSKEQAAAIRKLNSKLLYLRKIRSRFYPQDRLASHIVGYVDIYGKARQGLECKYEEYLLDNPNSKLSLSLDSRLQVHAEKVLSSTLYESKAHRGTAIVMKVKTGEILAWAVKPDYNPNKYYESSMNQSKNWSLVDVYQPGSIFKIITVASALDSETVTPGHKFIDKGYLEVDKWKIKNHDYIKGKTKAEELGLQELFERSSNPFAAHLALAMGPEVFYKYIRKFGFGNKTRIELEGETKGILHKFNKWRKSDTATTGIGHGAISITPIQLLAAVNTIANDGYWVRPTLFKVKKNEIAQIEKEKVLKMETAHMVADMLANSIQHNIENKYAMAGKVTGLRVAGKTGTAEKIKAGGGYSKRHTVASFLGFFPAESPKYITLVVIDDPKTAGGWGDTVAGPAFNRIAAYIKNLYL